MKSTLRTVTILCAVCFLCATATAQTIEQPAIIEMVDGAVLKGAFLRADKSVVEIENTHGRQSIRLEKVKSIRFDRSKLAVSERKSSAPYSGLNFQIPAPDIQSTPDVSNQGTSRETRPTYSRKSSRARSYRTYIRGPRGGCYYINGNGNKTYVDRSLCQ